MEIVAFGLPFYFISGLAYEARAFFVFLAILIGMYHSNYLCACTLFLLHTNILSLRHTVTSGARDSLQICIENAFRSTSPDSTEEGQCAGRWYSLLLTSYFDVRVYYLSVGDTKLLEMAILGQPHGMGAAGYGVESVLVIEVFRVFM